MTVVVPHRSAQAAAIAAMDQPPEKLLGAELSKIQIEDQLKSWEGPVMTFSFTGKLGYISVPFSGTIAVDDANVTLECELPPLVKNFLGEERFRAMMEENIKALLQPA